MLASAGLYPIRVVTADRPAVRAVLIATALAFLGAVPAAAAARGVRRGAAPGPGRLSRRHHRAGRARGDPAHSAGRRDRRALERGLRHRCGVGDREVRVQGQEPADHADRSAVLGLAGDRRADLRPAVRRPGAARSLAGGARHQDHLRRARDRARDHLRDLPVRRARADPADAGAGRRGGGGGAHARRRRLADLPPGDAAQRQMGPALRRAAVQRPRDGRVRRGLGGVRPHPRPHQHHAAARRDPLQRVQLRRRVRGRFPSHPAGSADARAEGRARVAIEARAASRSRASRGEPPCVSRSVT